ncbi:MAG: Fur family transcriptional regulator [Cyclobacteriaceae bacterium]
MAEKGIREKLMEKNLRVTPQRIAVYEAVKQLKFHPLAENIHEHVKKEHPNLALGTVYKILDMLVENGLIRRVKTDKDHVRYDAITEKHHHLYCYESDRIEDYFDRELDELINNYFQDKNIPGFTIKDVKLQLVGRFRKH